MTPTLTDIQRDLATRNFVEIKNLDNPQKTLKRYYCQAYRQGLNLRFATLDKSVFVFKKEKTQ